MSQTTHIADLPQSKPVSRPRASAAIIALWCMWGALIACLAGSPPVRRTQEARVLETAREMLGSGFRGWMVPHLNGRMRLQKPPLAYWLSAISFKVFGVNEWAGRIPSVLAAWLTVTLVFHAAFWLFCRRAALFSALATASSLLFCRSMLRAETDGLTSLFVSSAIYCIWRASTLNATGATPNGTGAMATPSMAIEITAPPPRGHALPYDQNMPTQTWDMAPGSSVKPRHAHASVGHGIPSVPPWLWFHLSSIAIGLAFMTKGPPGLFALLFLLGLACSQRSSRLIWQWFRCGAPLTLIALAAPWWIYLLLTFGPSVIWKELHDVIAGEDHPAWFFVYIPWLLVAVVPWCLAAPIAIAEAFRHHHDDRVGGLLIWSGAVLLPLCLIGNKQDHYLLPLIPPLMVLVGWLLDSAMDLGGEPHPDRRSRLILGGVCITILATFLAVPAILIAPKVALGKIRSTDVMVALAVAATLGPVIWILQKRGALWGTIVYGIACAVALPTLLALWAPSLNRSNTRDIASSLRASYGSGPYCFYGDDAYLPLCFAMRQEIPFFKTPAELAPTSAASPELVVLQHPPKTGKTAAPPPDFVQMGTIGEGDERIIIFRRSTLAHAP